MCNAGLSLAPTFESLLFFLSGILFSAHPHALIYTGPSLSVTSSGKPSMILSDCVMSAPWQHPFFSFRAFIEVVTN